MGYEKATQNTTRHLYVQQEDLTVTFFSKIAKPQNRKCVGEEFINSHDRSAYSAAGKYMD